tara:strand:+ start:676 stop:879 length:204 start_codon:yes stop_codon:yes gene_type:complete
MAYEVPGCAEPGLLAEIRHLRDLLYLAEQELQVEKAHKSELLRVNGELNRALLMFEAASRRRPKDRS